MQCGKTHFHKHSFTLFTSLIFSLIFIKKSFNSAFTYIFKAEGNLSRGEKVVFKKAVERKGKKRQFLFSEKKIKKTKKKQSQQHL